MIVTRRTVLAGALSGTLMAWSTGRAAPPSPRPVAKQIAQIDEDLVSGILDAGQWRENADDNAKDERLPADLVDKLCKAYDREHPSDQAIAGMGLLCLTLAVAEWGVRWPAEPPEDPDSSHWRGPGSIRQGKHLMSYALGGIGIAHLDVGGAVRFFSALGSMVPEAKADLQEFQRASFHYDPVRACGGVCAGSPKNTVLMTDLDGNPFLHEAAYLDGAGYCRRFNRNRELDAKAWQRFRHWCRVGLRRRDVQEWIMRDWLNKYWVPAFNQVMAHHLGSIEEVFIVARIRNSSNSDAIDALRAARNAATPADRISLELANYGSKSKTKAGRRGVMQRPGAAYAHFVQA